MEGQGFPKTHSTPTGSTMNGLNSPTSIARSLALNALPPGLSDGRILNDVSSSGTEESKNPWTSFSPHPAETRLMLEEANRPYWPRSMPTTSGNYIDQQQAATYRMYTPEQRQSSRSWRMPFGLGQNDRITGFIELINEGFHYKRGNLQRGIHQWGGWVSGE